MPRPATSPMRWPTDGGAGEADHVDLGRGHQGLGRLGALAHQHVQHARRQAGLGEHLAEGQDGQRVLRGRLDHHGVAHGQGRADLAGGVGEREVVRRMAATTPDRAPDGPPPPMIPPGRQRGGGHDPRAARDLELLVDAPGVVAEAGGGLGHLHLLGHPQGGARSRPAPAGRARRSAASSRSAARSRMAARSSGAVRDQAGKASAAACGRGLGVGRAGVGGVADHRLGGRVDDLVGAVAAVDPLAADEQR